MTSLSALEKEVWAELKGKSKRTRIRAYKKLALVSPERANALLAMAKGNYC